MRGASFLVCAYLVLASLSIANQATAEETSPPPESSAAPEQVDIQPPDAESPQQADAEADAAKPDDEDSAEDRKEKTDIAYNAPSDGSEDGERLAGLDSMGKIQSASDYAGNSGELKYKIDIDTPEFRNLAPELGLIYNSQVTGKTGAGSLMGPGWALKGFSSIERQSSYRGAPTYKSGQDIFLLDGMEMLKCAGGNITIAGTSTAYPASHIKSNASAGCDAGGHFTTLNETYFRIKYLSGSNQFELTQKNGVKFIYESVHALAPSQTVSGDDYRNMRERRKWLLTRIEDTQSNKNTVAISYRFDTSGRSYYWQGYPERPHRIDYAGYRVEFHYSQQTNPVATFTTGTKYLGRQYQLLEAISVMNGSTKIRAYDLSYTRTPVTKINLLTQVRQIGTNFTVNSNGTVSGTALPAHKFEYNADGYTVQNRWYDNFETYVHATKVHNGVHDSTASHGAENRETFHGAIRTVETNGDGIDEILALDVKPNGTGNPHYRERSGHFTFDINGNMTRNTSAYAIPTGRFTDGGSYWTFLGMNRWTPDQNRPMAIRGRFYNTDDRRYLEANPLTAGWYNNRQVESARAKDRIHWLTGNFDDDPEIEVMIRDSIYDVQEVASNANERFPKKSLTRTTHSRCTGRTWVNARVVDVNADGIDDVFFKATESGLSSQYCIRIVTANGYIDAPSPHASGSNRVITCCANVENRLYWAFGFGDFNGDGVMDSVRFGNVDKPTSVDQLDLAVSFGHGDGTFSGRSTWFENIDMLGLANGDYYANAVIPTDLNGDGLDDVVVYGGYDDGTYSWKKSKYPGPIRMFLSTGTGFVETKMFSSGAIIRNFGTIGDFNGDGVKDLAYGDSTSKHRPRILFGSSKAGHRITKITTNIGEVINVSYKPSTHFPGDQTPYVRQLVHKVTTNPGIGPSRTVEFSYKNGRYDYHARKPLGFQEIQIKLPRVAGETADLVQVTQYMTGHVAEIGLITRQFIKYGSTTYQDTQNTWTVIKSGRGPYRTMKTREKKGTRHGNRVIYKTKDFTYNVYNDILTEIDRGFDGAQDDVSVAYRYNPNVSAYIVNKVAVRATVRGASPSTSKDNANRIAAEYFQYDGNGVWEIPTRGNLTKQKIWDGQVARDSSKTQKEATYDAYGNIIEERNGRGYRTTFTFTGPRMLFEATQTNAKGHRTTSAWNYGCQKPTQITDPNGLITSFTYDTFCRETLKRVAWGTSGSQMQDYNTRYRSFGNASAQYVEKYQKSGNSDSGQLWQYSRQYFDGMGKVYKETKSGAVSDISASSVTVRSFDQRGRTLWESNPISWNDANDNVANSNQRVSYSYDPMGRVTRMTFADGAYRRMEYSNWRRTYQGQETYYPQVNTFGEQCHDNNPDTVCEETQQSVDADGNMIFRFHADRALTDVDSGTSIWRTTRYEYDHQNRLTKVVDPGGLTFSYKYDTYGNRIEQTDPGLGRWQMEYYADNTLKRQIDAKGQEIYFWYDELGREERKRVQKRDDAGAHVSYTNTYTRYDGEESTTASGYYYIGFLTKQWTDGADTHTIENRYDRRGNVVWQNNTTNGKTYNWLGQYTVSSKLYRQTYFYNPGSTSRKWTPVIKYDTADRQVAFGSYITSSTYDLWGNMTERRYGNGARSLHTYNAQRGWVTRMRHYDKDGRYIAHADYTKSVSGRVLRVNSVDKQGDLEYTYDYAGRLLEARYYGSLASIGQQVDQSFAYDKAGRMRSNSKLGAYSYSGARTVGSNGKSINGHAPNSILVVETGATQTLRYDANGNMTHGLHGKVMEYDGENRPLSVTYQGNTTRYVYGADGTRLKKIERAGTAQQTVTLYLNGTEIRQFGQGSGAEEMVTHLADEVRISDGGGASTRLDYLHYDQLGSVIGLSNNTGTSAERRTYLAFGKTSYERQFDASLKEETKGFVGERYDADAGLQFLNARYYDPELALFIQPDWFEVTEPGVGENRYAYSMNDPINNLDPKGNLAWFLAIPLAIYQGISIIQSIISLTTFVPQLIATIQAGNFAQIGSWVIQYAVEEAISRIPGGRLVPARVTRAISNGIIRGLRPLGFDPENLGRAVHRSVCGLSSFDGSTQVVTPTGRKRLDSLLLGQMVLSKDEITGTVDFRKVTKQHVADYNARYDVTITDQANEKTQVLKSSWSHPFFVRVPVNTPMAVGAEGLVYQGPIEWGHWMDAADLQPGYELLNDDGTWSVIDKVTPIEDNFTAYNLTVEEFSTYFVAANDNDTPVWVHNVDCPRPQTGRYGATGGHHVHAKAAFKDHVNYSNRDGFAISQQYMNDLGFDHDAMTRYQRSAFRELHASGRGNTMREHTRIAVEALEAGGASRAQARELVAESLNMLRANGVRVPTNIPWYR